MTTLRYPRRRGARTPAGVLAAALILLTGAPAAADPSPTPSAPAGAAAGATVPKAAPGSITWAVQPSSAQGPDGRSTFSYANLKPGTVIHDYVGVTNFSAMPVTFTVYASDAFNTASGSLDLLPADQEPKDIGSWVSVLKNTVTLQPGERVNEPFSVTIPASAAPGDHTGGVIASITVDAKNSQGTTVKVDRRIAVPLYLRVVGVLHPGLKIESVSSDYHGTVNPFKGGGVDVTYTVHNTGNVRVDLGQEVTATGLFGLTIAHSKLKPVQDLLPGSSYQVKVHLDNVFPLGPMGVHIKGTPSEVAGVPPAPTKPEAVSFDVGMWATPWLLLLILVLGVGGFFGVRWFLRFRRRRRDETVAAAVARARRDTVEQLKKRATAAKAAAGAGKGDGGAGTETSG